MRVSLTVDINFDCDLTPVTMGRSGRFYSRPLRLSEFAMRLMKPFAPTVWPLGSNGIINILLHHIISSRLSPVSLVRLSLGRLRPA